MSPEKFDALVTVNFKHALFAAQMVAPLMAKAVGGSIINLGSRGWMMGVTGYPAYTATKAAMHGPTRVLAREFGHQRIRVNTSVPGWVMTERQVSNWVDEESEAQIDMNQCLPGGLFPHHIASMALFLASDACAMCSAQNFIVDGGWG